MTRAARRFVATTPVCEEILYRGLLVTWLRRVGWGDSAVLLAGSLIFGANHFIPLSFVWSVAMVGFGAILFGLRPRYDSLSPGWLSVMSGIGTKRTCRHAHLMSAFGIKRTFT
jgi:membrane protease YdiL (CAAX protease family)